MLNAEEVAANRARAEREIQKARAYLLRRRPTDGLAELEADEDRRRARIYQALDKLVAELQKRGAEKWARCVEGSTEAGQGMAAMEDVLGYTLLRAGPPGWHVTLDSSGWRTILRYARSLAKRTGNREWETSPAWVAQLIANAGAPRLLAEFNRVVKLAQRIRIEARNRRARAGASYEVFIEHQLGGAYDELLQGTDPYISTSEIVNCFLRDRVFMAELLAAVREDG